MSVLYLDTLHNDILLLLISKLDNINNIIKASFRVRWLLQTDRNSEIVFKYKDKDLYNFIKNINNIVVYPDWFRSLTYSKFWQPFTSNIKQITEEVPRGQKYLSDILWSYHLSLDFPKFYNEVKDIKLHIAGVTNEEIYWKDIYLWCNEFKGSKFIQGSFTLDDFVAFTAGTIDIMARQEVIQPMMLLMSMGMLIAARHDKNAARIPLENLYTAFLLSADTYDKLCHLDDKTLIIDPDIASTMSFASDEEYLLDVFLSDIREKFGIVIT